MSENLMPLLIAVVGVVGTALSPWVTAQVTRRAKMEELEHQERVATKQFVREREEQEWALQRTCFAAANQAMRDYRSALIAWAYGLDLGGPEAAGRQKATRAAREAYRLAYADAQMMLPAEALDLADVINSDLARVYAMLCRIDEGRAQASDSTGAARKLLEDRIWVRGLALRDAMRQSIDRTA